MCEDNSALVSSLLDSASVDADWLENNGWGKCPQDGCYLRIVNGKDLFVTVYPGEPVLFYVGYCQLCKIGTRGQLLCLLRGIQGK